MKLEKIVLQTEKKYKELIRNDGNFCSFCETPIEREEGLQ